MFGIGTTELLIIFAIIIILFGSRRLPELAKSIAQGIRLFKKELNSEDTSNTDKKDK